MTTFVVKGHLCRVADEESLKLIFCDPLTHAQYEVTFSKCTLSKILHDSKDRQILQKLFGTMKSKIASVKKLLSYVEYDKPKNKLFLIRPKILTV